MSEKSNIQCLKDFAKSQGRSLEVHEYEYPMTSLMIRKFPKFKKQAYMPINDQGTAHFVWFSDHYEIKSAGELYAFCGAFIPVAFPKKAWMKIRSKNIVDRFKLFGDKGVKTGASSFDSKVIVKSNHREACIKLLSKARLQRAIIGALKDNPSLVISINENDLDFVPSLKGTSHLSIMNPQLWYLEYEEINPIIKSMEDIQQYTPQ